MANSSIKNLNIDGNVVISGSTTSVDVATVMVDDKNIVLNEREECNPIKERNSLEIKY